ncbi:TetR/AcrR family transcriptional regulator [Bacillus testis]|uniref:TetR/AcrR family transcriptional regulator n=1 Tax=Bacillus testis TaxID=1622072 RepID=UPI00067EF240|nr:TetR/AcrR family transcriptional regulator [Bacillus testis]
MAKKRGAIIVQLKDRIIETSLKLFEQHGFHGVSVHQIVQESGTSKGGFYHHFHSKDELLYVIHDYFISYVLQKAREATSKRITPTEKLLQIIQSFVKVFDLYKPHISVFYQESMYLKPPYEQQIKKKRNDYRAIIDNVIQEGMEAGEFRDELPVGITGMAVLGMINWTYKWYKSDGVHSIDEIAAIYSDIIFQALWTQNAKQNPVYQQYRLGTSRLLGISNDAWLKQTD